MDGVSAFLSENVDEEMYIRVSQDLKVETNSSKERLWNPRSERSLSSFLEQKKAATIYLSLFLSFITFLLSKVITKNDGILYQDISFNVPVIVVHRKLDHISHPTPDRNKDLYFK